MAERLKAAVLKTVVEKFTGGSNPSLSATYIACRIDTKNATEERWLSGRKHCLAKAASGKLLRGFKSHSLRHFLVLFSNTHP
jgi:hypothetical protein